MPKDACYHKVKARYRVFPSAYASGAIAKCRKVGAENYGTGGKKKAKKKAEGGVIELKKGGNVPKRTRKRKTKNPNIARGCGAVMSSRRKVTKFR
jgi:hypothetical protein|tara:strand:- start:3272 stop:3556 length:285 start_codon:yes stop_codon:yes gene_type:complete